MIKSFKPEKLIKIAPMKSLNLIKEIALLLFFICAVVSCAINPVTGKRQLMLMSEAQEIQMGAEYDPQVIATFGEYKDEQTLSFIQARADEMGKISHRPNLKYHVKIVDSPVVNAFAVPGGYIYLTRGILAQFNNEAELVGVLGHEMGHINARHSVSTQSKQTVGQLLLLGGMIASEEFASYAQYAMQGMQLLFLKFSRDNERQADQLGVAYSSQIGYDANKMADFFQVLKKMSMPAEQGGIPTFYHPELKFRFSFPAGWQFENLPTQVNMAPSDGKTLIVFTFAPGSTLDEAANNALQQLELKPQESLRTSINNLPAIVTQSKQVYQDQSTGQQQSNIIMSCFIDYDNTYFVFHGVTAEANYNIYGDPFMVTMNTFSRLTDPVKINKKPVKILIKRVQRTGTLADAFKYYGIKQDKMNELALLNNLELNDRVQAGNLIKVTGY